MPSTEGALKRRNRGLQVAKIENSTQNKKDEKKVEENPRKTLRYYWNRFRYYHYCFAEKLDNLIGVVCCAMIRIILFCMGWENQLATQDDEMTSVLGMDDD